MNTLAYIFSKPFHLLVVVCVMLSGCASRQRFKIRAIVPRSEFGKGQVCRDDIFDFRLRDIDVNHVEMSELVFRLNNQIKKQTGFSGAFFEQKANSGYLNPNSKVHYCAHDVSLGEALDAICQETGWTYKKTPVGVLFVEGGEMKQPTTVGCKKSVPK